MPRLQTLPFALRPRERLLHGDTPVSLEHLLAILISTGSSHEDALDLAEKLAPVVVQGGATFRNLQDIKGLGETKIARILAALALPESITARRLGQHLADPAGIHLACSDLWSEEKEVLVVFYLNVRFDQLLRETVAVGTVNASLVHPREVFRTAIQQNASYVVLAHNHPSGDPMPSGADIEATRMMIQAGELMCITLVDHVITSQAGYYSFRQEQPELFP